MQIFREDFFADYKELIYCFGPRLHLDLRIHPKRYFFTFGERGFIKMIKILINTIFGPKYTVPVADDVAAGVELEWSWRVCRLLCSGGKAAAALRRRRSGGKAAAALRRRRSGGVAAAPTAGRRRRRRRRCGG